MNLWNKHAASSCQNLDFFYLLMVWHLRLSLERVFLFLKVQLVDIFVWYKSCDAMKDINFAFVKG